MKTKIISLTVMFLMFATITFSQTKAKLYTAEEWLEVKGKMGASAYGDTHSEKVEVLVTDKNIKVTFGTKVYDYKIISINTYSWNVKLKGKKFEIYLIPHFNTVTFSCVDNWEVETDVTWKEVEIQ